MLIGIDDYVVLGASPHAELYGDSIPDHVRWVGGKSIENFAAFKDQLTARRKKRKQEIID